MIRPVDASGNDTVQVGPHREVRFRCPEPLPASGDEIRLRLSGCYTVDVLVRNVAESGWVLAERM